MNTSTTRQDIEERLRTAFRPTELLVKDQSHLHAGHAGAQRGGGHFEVIVVSDHFDGKSRIARHRMVFDALGKLMENAVHALSIHAFTPSERD